MTLKNIFSVVSLVGAALLLFLAMRGWANVERASLPDWRNRVAVAALLVGALNWVMATMATIFVFQGTIDATNIYLVSKIAALVGVVLGLALKRGSRIQIVLASLLLFLSGPLGYI